MKKTALFALFLLLAAAGAALAQAGPEWLRYPAISPDGKTIVFT
jgi:tricorn protease